MSEEQTAEQANVGTAVAATVEAAIESVSKEAGKAPVVVYHPWCKGCGICVAFCPKHVLELGEDGLVSIARPEDCVNCDLCDVLCPDLAIFSPGWPERGRRRFGRGRSEGQE